MMSTKTSSTEKQNDPLLNHSLEPKFSSIKKCCFMPPNEVNVDNPSYAAGFVAGYATALPLSGTDDTSQDTSVKIHNFSFLREIDFQIRKDIPGDIDFQIEVYNDMSDTIFRLGILKGDPSFYWNWIKDNPPSPQTGYSFSKEPIVTLIHDSLKYQGHSGASFALCMRTMQDIACKGWANYVKDFKLSHKSS